MSENKLTAEQRITLNMLSPAHAGLQPVWMKDPTAVGQMALGGFQQTGGLSKLELVAAMLMGSMYDPTDDGRGLRSVIQTAKDLLWLLGEEQRALHEETLNSTKPAKPAKEVALKLVVEPDAK